MKNEQQELARQMYMQSNKSKTEIAEQLGVNRRTIYQWSVDGDWDTLRASARCMPSILTQKCYHIIGHLTDHILQRDVAYQTVTKDEVVMLSRLVNNVTKLRSGSTVSENMETLTLFLEGMKQKDAGLADEVLPHVEEFITSKATMAHSSFILDGYQEDGGKPFHEKELTEKWQDEKDYNEIVRENRTAHQSGSGEVPVTDEPTHITYSNGFNTYKKPNPKHPDNKTLPVTDDSAPAVSEKGGQSAQPGGNAFPTLLAEEAGSPTSLESIGEKAQPCEALSFSEAA